ncbi:hypothetical protein COY28_00245 [Candidatus Woesearchaeota archaeon CG_4_10_14_0_2_um_filter_57_5]|nr:MAG: hypothetical protein AUJ68_07255 [Candidatus Woesearchaeota archaeon CG1_02_57_44]PIN68354.1 MAG: hypothetical protein COV94_05115 [Candidatus Woesearchaeota archaeon CG11_big_fil_rev_8_21_14_0_20_57_5]PIZ57251.1 MAG: hypothetical protein COY28_00245 [Candidatus Woesearchaeota archaeon CG_4_10_14_0_2_um_filter_57_5]
MEIVYHTLGGIGLLLITIGIITHKRLTQDVLYLVGGILLEIYSLYIRDNIFIILQLVFILAALVDLVVRHPARAKGRATQKRQRG